MISGAVIFVLGLLCGRFLGVPAIKGFRWPHFYRKPPSLFMHPPSPMEMPPSTLQGYPSLGTPYGGGVERVDPEQAESLYLAAHAGEPHVEDWEYGPG